MERQRRVLMVILLAALGSFSEAYCPFLCQCDDTKRKVVCSPKANLDIIPITLNPAIKEIHLRGNQIRYVSLGTMHGLNYGINPTKIFFQNC